MTVRTERAPLRWAESGGASRVRWFIVVFPRGLSTSGGPRDIMPSLGLSLDPTARGPTEVGRARRHRAVPWVASTGRRDFCVAVARRLAWHV